jgi:hypothetical protein
MTLNANNLPRNKSKGNRVQQPPLEAGVAHAARLVQVIDLGLQAQRPYKGNAKEPRHSLYVTYEFSHIFLVDEKGEENQELPRRISEEFALFPLISDRAVSTRRYLAFDPKEEKKGDWAKLLGSPCSLLVVNNPDQNDKTRVFSNVGNVTPAPRMPGYVQPELVNDPVVFDLDAPDIEVFKSLPEFLQNKIKANLNYQGSKLQGLLGEVESKPVVAPAAVQAPDEDNPY